MRVLLVENPRSGSQRAARVPALLERAGADVEVVAIDDVDGVERADADRVAVAGGDGSLGGAADLAARSGVPLAVIPCGTANDFARAAQLPLTIEAACVLAAGGERLRTIDLACIDGRTFLNVASAGLSVRAARHARGLKHSLGSLAYAVGAVRAGLAGEPLRVRLDVDGAIAYEGLAWQVVIANTGAFGGGAAVAVADAADARLDAVLIPRQSRLGLVRRAWGLRLGTIAAQPGVVHARAAHLAAHTDQGRTWVVDGELVRARSGATPFHVRPAALRLVVG